MFTATGVIPNAIMSIFSSNITTRAFEEVTSKVATQEVILNVTTRVSEKVTSNITSKEVTSTITQDSVEVNSNVTTTVSDWNVSSVEIASDITLPNPLMKQKWE